MHEAYAHGESRTPPQVFQLRKIDALRSITWLASLAYIYIYIYIYPILEVLPIPKRYDSPIFDMFKCFLWNSLFRDLKPNSEKLANLKKGRIFLNMAPNENLRPLLFLQLLKLKKAKCS